MSISNVHFKRESLKTKQYTNSPSKEHLKKNYTSNNMNMNSSGNNNSYLNHFNYNANNGNNQITNNIISKDKDPLSMLLDDSDSDYTNDKLSKKHIFLTKENENKAAGLIKDINGLETKINEILKNQHWKYMTSFDSFMEEIRNELLEKINEMKRKEKDKRKNENVHLITCERDFYKQEAIRLNLICKELHAKNESLVNESKFLKTDNRNLSQKWKDSERINKHLLIELEKNIERLSQFEDQYETTKNTNQSKKQLSVIKDEINKNNNDYMNMSKISHLENEIDNSNIHLNTIEKESKERNNDDIVQVDIRDGFSNRNNINPNLPNIPKLQMNNINSMNNTFFNKIPKMSNVNMINNMKNMNNTNSNFNFNDNINKEGNIDTKLSCISQLNKKLKLEKKKYFDYVSEVNQNQYKKNNLEKIFVESVETVKKDIMKRKFINNNSKKSQINYLPEHIDLEKEINKFTNSNKTELLLKDKYALLENFLLNEEILGFLQKSIFSMRMEESNAFAKTNYTFNSTDKENNSIANSNMNTFVNFPKFNNIARKLNPNPSAERFNSTGNSLFPKNNRMTGYNSMGKTKSIFNKTFHNNKMHRLERVIAFY